MVAVGDELARHQFTTTTVRGSVACPYAVNRLVEQDAGAVAFWSDAITLARAVCRDGTDLSLLVEGRFANARASNLSIGSTLGNDLLRYHDPKSHQ